ncbi:MAG: hypothetical protein NZ473_02480, partial [Candidatus Kapabacteria bacterium]|nr:hypothetical protein [Candidatus Kapabacteria bacterium]
MAGSVGCGSSFTRWDSRVLHDAWLGQNIPNPHEGTTTIPYSIPAGVGRAELVVRDPRGRELRRVELPERGAHGQVTLEMRLLGAGVYEY